MISISSNSPGPIISVPNQEGKERTVSSIKTGTIEPSGNKQSLMLNELSPLQITLCTTPIFFLTSGLLLYRAYYADNWKSLGATFEFLKLIQNHW